jgi:cyclopropane-fatty-acyl-phospholipid synthase
MFRSPNGQTHLFQIVYCRGNVRNYPMSRAHVYAPVERAAGTTP